MTFKSEAKEPFLNKSALLAMVSCHISGLIFLPLMPLVMSAFARDLGASSTWLGTIASIQLGATAIGAFSFSIFGSRFNCRTFIVCAISFELVLNIATAISHSMFELSLLRGLSGFTQGILLAAAGATAALSRKTERIFVYYNVTLAVFAVVFLFIGARVIPAYGHKGAFLLFSAVDLLALIFICKGLPRFLLAPKPTTSRLPSLQMTAISHKAFIALAFFGAALAGTQTFIEQIGIWRGAMFDTVANSLALGWCLAIVSPFWVMPLIKRYESAMLPLIAAYICIASVALTLSLTESLTLYLVAAALFTPIILFIEPLQFGVLGRIDETGRLAALGPAAISIGSGTGPLMASLSVEKFGLGSIGIFAGLLIIMSFLFLYPLVVRAYKQSNIF